MLIGIGLKVASALVFTIMAAMVRSIGGDLPAGEVVFCRSFFAIFPILVWLAWRGDIAAIKTRNVFGHFLRTFIGISSMFCGFSALARIPLGDATAIGYASPLLSVALAALILGEKVRVYRWSAVVVGLLGVVVILWPHLTQGALGTALSGQGGASRTSEGVLFALAGAVLTAGAMIQVRRLTQMESTASIVFFFSLFGALFALVTVPFGWKMPTGGQALTLVATGICGGIGQILLTQSYRYAEASVVAPFDYTSLIWAVLLGYALFGDLPDAYVVVGGVIVVGSGVFVIFRERQLGIERGRARQADVPPLR